MQANPIPAQQGRLMDLGARLLGEARRQQSARGAADRWLETVLARSLSDERFRVQLLRFVDVMPSLSDDTALLAHLREYFAEGELPLPGLARWGLAHTRGALLAGAVRTAVNGMARRFIGGADPAGVLDTVRRLTARGLDCTLDRLGEAVVSEVEADAYVADCLRLVEHLGGARVPGEGGPLELSVKVSSLYSRLRPLDPEGGVEHILGRLRPLLLAARGAGISVCLDMEQYALKETTLAAFRAAAMLPELRDWSGLGLALQAYLRDSERDLEALARWAERRGTAVTVRLVRGAYWDQEVVLARQHGWSPPVWSSKGDTDRAYERCLGSLFAAWPGLVPAVATHNPRSLALAMLLAEELGRSPAELEFQMLYGMAEPLRAAVRALGYRMRVYVPFGRPLPGMAYLVRRLLENSSSQSFQGLAVLPDRPLAEVLAPPPAGAAEEGGAPREEGYANVPVHRYTEAPERDALAGALARVRAELGADYPLIIGGRERVTGEWVRSLNPARPAETLGRAAAAGPAEADAALTAAQEALEDWSRRPAKRRAGLLEGMAEAMLARRDELAAWEVLEVGKTWPEADADVCEAVDYLRYYAREARRLGRGGGHELAGEENRYRYVARGVVVVLPPWNFPLAIITGMTAAALVTGNTVVLKPSSQAPLVAARAMRLWTSAGLPPGVINLVAGPGESLGEQLARDRRCHMIAFTGSAAVGLRLNRLAAEPAPGQRHVRRVLAEMGGKNAIIVDADADLDEAVAGVIASAFGYQGQKCSACSRVVVLAPIYDTYLERLVEAARSLVIGPPEAPGTDLGPVIQAAAAERIQGLVAAGRARARAVLDLPPPRLDGGFYLAPTVFAEVEPGDSLAREEIFGPVLSVLRARDLDEAFAIANGTSYALTGGLYSRSPHHLARAAQELEVGNLYLNRGITGALVGRQPFGGSRLSGMGSKAGGPDYLLQFVEARCVTENTLRRGYAPSR